MSNVPSLEVEDLQKLIQSGSPVVILDVREERENAICSIPGSILIPLGQLSEQLAELAKEKKIVVHCHHGGRSARAVAYLLEKGYKDVHNLKGGIHAWSERIDPKVKTYS